MKSLVLTFQFNHRKIVGTFPLAKNDLINFESCVILIESFIITSKKPYYGKLELWQFNILKNLILVNFGKRYTICIFSDNQPCMDYDRFKRGNTLTSRIYF